MFVQIPTCCELVYNILILSNPTWATFLVSFCTTITHQATELESCSNTQEMQKNEVMIWKTGKFWICFFFVGDVIKRSFRHFWPTSSGPGPQPKETILCFSFLNQISWNSTLGRANCGLMSQISMLSWSKLAVEQLLFEVSSVNIFMETNQKIKNCTISTLKMPEQFLF